MDTENRKRLVTKPWLMAALLVVLFIAALGIRLYDLTDPPNDYYLVRQYRSLLIARGMYYEHLDSAPDWQRQVAVAQWKAEPLIEPPLMERMVSLIYMLTGEHFWVGLVLSSLFWLSGGLALWLLARDLSMPEGGLLALAYYLFLPFAVTASRTFMPDPLMTALIGWSLWALHRWEMRRTWKLAILAGILTGLAVFVKSVAVFPLLGAAAAMVLGRGSWKKIFADRQTWALAGIAAVPTVLYYIYGMVIVGTLGGQFGLRFFPALLKDPSFYARWTFLAAGLAGFAALFASLAGILLFRSRQARLLTIGAWAGYIVCGVVFAYHYLTHEYYHLPIVLITALGLIPLADALMGLVAEQRSRLPRLAFAGLLAIGLLMQVWQSRNTLANEDYRPEVAYWRDLGNLIGHDQKVVELAGDYGYRLAYWGWIHAVQWQNTADLDMRSLAGEQAPDFASTFAAAVSGSDLFVVISIPEWDNQPELKTYVTEHYPLVVEGDGYLIFDLKP